jgi:probable phosphoglycerate mutase
MTTTILLIRHGETDWNAARRLQGHTDIGLNDAGVLQADALGRALAQAPLAAVIASDLSRARQTAQAVAVHHGIELRIDSQLRERCYGGFEGLQHAQIAKVYPQHYAAWQARDIDALMPPGERIGESFRQFFTRSTQAIAHWAEQYPGRTIAIVAHGGVLECAHRAARALSLTSARDFEIKNASINRFSFSSQKLTLLDWGDINHLAAAAIDELA